MQSRPSKVYTVFWRVCPLRTFVILITTVFILCSPVSSLFSSELGDAKEAVVFQGTKQGLDNKKSLNLEEWGIYNGCISSNHIRKIKVLDAHSALLSLVDGKKVKIYFMKRCDGIKRHGFVYTARNNMFCTHNYSVRVLHTGTHCQVEAIEPYLDAEPE